MLQWTFIQVLQTPAGHVTKHLPASSYCIGESRPILLFYAIDTCLLTSLCYAGENRPTLLSDDTYT